MSKRYSGKSFKDSTVMKKAKLSLKEKRKIKKDKKKNKWNLVESKNVKAFNTRHGTETKFYLWKNDHNLITLRSEIT